MSQNAKEKIKDLLLEEIADNQSKNIVSEPSERKLFIEIRNSDWGHLYNADTHPRLYCINDAEEFPEREAWHFETSPYAVYNSETKLWEFDVPEDHDIIEVFCNKQTWGYNWYLSHYDNNYLCKLPPEGLYRNIKLVQNVSGIDSAYFDADTNTRKILFQGQYNEEQKRYVAHYGSWTTGPEKIDVLMTPMGYTNNGYGRLQYYYVDVPEFDDAGNRIDDIYFTCDETNFKSECFT
ncbi:MAG: hypothetical protein Q8876_01070, partial [Bacillota bacterium]|nr:hypothetical protein [Bacillota bacterium]